MQTPPMQQPADRYAALLVPDLRETTLIHAPRRLDELELQAHWFAGDFGREFRTIDGRAVRLVQFGVWNREAGPDFAEAAISIDGGEALRGPIEFDIDARDWERHGHATNADYEPVILHVFTQTGATNFFTRTLGHRNVPQVLLDVSRIADAEPPNPQPEAKLGRCSGPLNLLPLEKVRDVLLAAAQHRFRRKSMALARLSEAHGADEALYQSLAATLGYKSNKLPFTLLAQRLPLRLLTKSKDEIEALLFGVSGFLPERDLQVYDGSTKDYLRDLWGKWWARRVEFGRIEIAPALWRMSGQRPVNHPQRRLAALAQIVRSWPQIRGLAERAEPQEIQKFFAKLSDPYWDRHYTLSSKASRSAMALVGESRVVEMLANVFLPLAAAHGEKGWAHYQELGAPLTNRRVETAATRLFGASSERSKYLESAALQQGLLQIYEDFCLQDASDCARCPFPRQLARW
ncbi:MAG TPA: DUF2851 family protein [Chthoniobacteraceae bacterium]